MWHWGVFLVSSVAGGLLGAAEEYAEDRSNNAACLKKDDSRLGSGASVVQNTGVDRMFQREDAQNTPAGPQTRQAVFPGPRENHERLSGGRTRTALFAITGSYSCIGTGSEEARLITGTETLPTNDEHFLLIRNVQRTAQIVHENQIILAHRIANDPVAMEQFTSNQSAFYLQVVACCRRMQADFRLG